MGNPVVHFEIIGKDPEPLRAFYRDIFDWEIAAPTEGITNPDYTLIKTDGISGGIGATHGGYNGHVTFYVGVKDMNASFAAIEGHGGEKMFGPDHVPGGPVIGMFRDPHGHAIGLVEIP